MYIHNVNVNMYLRVQIYKNSPYFQISNNGKNYKIVIHWIVVNFIVLVYHKSDLVWKIKFHSKCIMTFHVLRYKPKCQQRACLNHKTMSKAA